MSGAATRVRTAALVLLALNGLGLLAWTLPRRAALGAAEQRLQVLRGEVGNERRRLAERQARADAQRDNARDEQRLRDSLPSRTTALVPTLEALEKMARSAGLRPRQRNYAETEVKGAGIVRVVVELPLEGRYASLVDFLGQVEAAREPLSVDSLALQREQGQARLRVHVSAWFAPGEAP